MNKFGYAYLFVISIFILGQSINPANADAQPETLLNRQKAILLYNQSIAPLNNGNYKEALEKLEKACQLCDDEPLIHCNYGTALLKAGRTDEAIEHFLKACSYGNCPAICWANLGAAYEIKHEPKPAIDAFKKFLAVNPSGSDADKVRAHIKMLKHGVIKGKDIDYTAEDYFDAATRQHRTRWATYKMPLKVYMASGDGINGFKPEYADLLQKAFEDWANVSEGKISIRFVNNKRIADITTDWSDDISKVANCAEGGQATYKGDSSGLTNVNITLLTVDPSEHSKLTSNTVNWLAHHEVGHALGLLGHSPISIDVMYFCSPVADSEIALSGRDIKTIRRLYSEELDPVQFTTSGASVIVPNSDDLHKTMCILNNQGLNAFHAGKDELAIQKFQAALVIEPTASAPMNNLIRTEYMFGSKLIKQGDLTHAEEHLKKALKLEEKVHNGDMSVIIESNEKILRMMKKDQEADALKEKYKAMY